MTNTSQSSMPLQDPLILNKLMGETKAAIKYIQTAASHDNWRDLQHEYIQNGAWNSPKTNRTLGDDFGRWGLDNRNVDSALAVRVWKVFRDEQLTFNILRERFLQGNPIVGACVLLLIHGREIGSQLSKNIIRDCVSSNLTHDNTNYDAAIQKATDRSTRALKNLGFLTQAGSAYSISTPQLDTTAFNILLHYHFAKTNAGAISTPLIIDHNFWKYLGAKSETEVYRAIQELSDRGEIDRQINVDNLNQTVTNRSYEDIVRIA